MSHSFLNYPSSASVSTASDISQVHYGRRDQQIFRRAGSAEQHRQPQNDSGGNKDFRGKLEGTRLNPWQLQQNQWQQNRQSPSAFDTAPMNENARTEKQHVHVPWQQLRPQSSPNTTQSSKISSGVYSSTSPVTAEMNRRSPVHSITNQTSNKSPPNKVSRGMVTKLVSLFSNKSSQETVSTGRSKLNTRSASNSSKKAQFSQSVQFQSQANNHRRHSSQESYQQQSNQHSSSPQYKSYPPISPSRSNAQSSVSGESSYNPVGWPGTVDKRGKTFQMEASYSEEESVASKRVDRGQFQSHAHHHSYQQQNQQNHYDQTVKFLTQQLRPFRDYPTQQYLQSNKQQNSFDCGDSQAELENWINGDDSVAASSGPVDLDEAYEQRSRPNNKWRQCEDLEDIAEHDRKATDSQEGFALNTAKRQDLTSPYRFSLKRKEVAAQDAVSSPGSVASSSLDEESIRRGIDTSHSENRVRASGRNVVHRTLPQQRLYDDDVDFGECDDEVGFDEYSPDVIQPRLDQQSHSENRMRASGWNVAHRTLPQQRLYDDDVDFGECDDEVDFDEFSPDVIQPRLDQQYDDEVDFECSPDRPRIQPPTEETLRLNNSRNAPPRPGGSMLKGYRGFIEKTRDVPNLMDDLESEANTSLGTNGEHRALGLMLPPPELSSRIGGDLLPPRPSSVGSSNVDSGSDVFEGIAGSNAPSISSSAVSGPRFAASIAKNLKREAHSFVSEYESFSFDPKETINPFRNQQTQDKGRRAFNNLDKKVDFVDPSLNLSAVSKGSAGTSSQHDIVDLDDFVDDEFDKPDLSMYCINPESVRLMVRAFRKMCTMQMEISSCEDTMLEKFEDLVDTKKRFALFEMRSRIMETDIDRGLDRCGGTNIVDDIVLTPYFQAMHRVRDAVIVSKAWRDGATPKDVVTAHLLTRRSAKSYFVRRQVERTRRPGAPYPQYWLEKVTWLDETDFAMMRCQSLGAGTMKGFEMFTIGDCQSILLKMTSENCTQLRRELRSAMMCQIEAEEIMQEEIDLDGDQYVVAEAEQLYRDATVDVKQLSMKLVLADKAFSLVRSRMEKLVETIESLLVHIEDGDAADEAPSSSEDDVEDFVDEEQEREKLVSRAKRAEMSAEIAIRETLLARQEAEKIKSEKQREIDDLKTKLAEMETQSQHLASRYSSFIAGSSYLDKIDAKSILEGSFDRDMEDARQASRDRAKLKFRERRAVATNKGEEMYQSLGFYSRSLNAVQRK